MEERFDYGVEVFEETLRSSFIDSAYSLDDRFAPRILANDKSSGSSVLSVLKTELSTCECFDFSVAFITSSGVQILVEILNELRRRKIPGRILTSTYLNFSDPAALRKLCEYPNIQVRVFQGNLHAKGFFFDKEGISTIIIGSSNLTQTALTCNKEWNVLFRSYGTSFRLAWGFKRALEDLAFFYHVSEAIDFGLRRNSKLYSDTYKDTAFVLNAKYTREEVCRLLEWDKEPNYQNIGGYFHDKKTNTFPVFINYDKDPSISITTMYEDRFISDRELIAISKSKRTLNSPEIVNLERARENGMRCFLFVRKNTNDKDDGTEFYFLGEIYPTGHFKQFVMKDSTASAVEIGYRLDKPVRADLYDYLLSDF